MHNCTCTCITDWHDILSLPQYISPAIELKNWWVMGQHLVTHDPCNPSDFRDPFDPWPMTHRPIPCSASFYSDISKLIGNQQKCNAETSLAFILLKSYKFSFITWCTYLARDLHLTDEAEALHRLSGLLSISNWLWRELDFAPRATVNPLKPSGIRWLHFEVFSAIQV